MKIIKGETIQPFGFNQSYQEIDIYVDNIDFFYKSGAWSLKNSIIIVLNLFNENYGDDYVIISKNDFSLLKKHFDIQKSFYRHNCKNIFYAKSKKIKYHMMSKDKTLEKYVFKDGSTFELKPKGRDNE